MLNPDEMIRSINALTARNKVLEDALVGVSRALIGQPIVQPIKIPQNCLKIKGITYMGSKNRKGKYQCDRCKKISDSRGIKTHKCPTEEVEEEKKKKTKKQDKTKKKKKRRKEKVIVGFTLAPSKKGGSLFYACNHCHTRLLESSTSSHRCRDEDRPVPLTVDAFVMESATSEEEEEEEDRDNPLYSGLIHGWSWHSHNNGYSMYKCDSCFITMRHDYVHKHQCRQIHENDIFSLL
jgi:hypothetical protein